VEGRLLSLFELEDAKMIWFATVFLVVVLCGGLARLLLILGGNSATFPDSERLLTRQKILSLAIVSIACSILGVFLLLKKLLGPLEVLVGVVLVVSLVEIAIRTVRNKAQS